MKALTLLLSLLPLVAWSGPDKTSTYLVNEPVSLMDLGLLRMELELKEFGSSGKFVGRKQWFIKTEAICFAK